MPRPSATTLIDRVDSTNEVVGQIARADALRVVALATRRRASPIQNVLGGEPR